MPFVVLLRHAKRPTFHVRKPGKMAVWGKPHRFPSKDEARDEAGEWAGIYSRIDPGYSVVIKEVP